MSEDDLKAVLAMYQQKAFELFNQNIVFETQINSQKNEIENLKNQIKKLEKIKANNN